MRRVVGEAPARAALLGNPSDGYGGHVVALALANFSASVELGEEAAGEPHEAAPLVDAAVGRFPRACGPFSASVETSIPRSVGLGGSSAIVIATLRALSALHDEPLDATTVARLALAAEAEDLGVAAGPQDRVVQAHGGLLSMDFADNTVERLDPASLPPLYLAWDAGAAQPSGRVHAPLRARVADGERAAIAGLTELAEIARLGRDAIEDGDHHALGELVDRTFDVRAELLDLDPRHVRLVEIARARGAHATFAGSGGAVVVIGGENAGGLASAYAADGCGFEAVRVAA